MCDYITTVLLLRYWRFQESQSRYESLTHTAQVTQSPALVHLAPGPWRTWPLQAYRTWPLEHAW